ncbi:MAG TPA: phosphatase PAP2 family protein [Gemmatimonadaceae bacterium]|nr:phosphatase PAP2 family protein [Gemmatimonadaceae bacterium]
MSPTFSGSKRHRLLRGALVAVVLIALSMLADGWVAEHVRYGRVYETDWGRMLRNFGYLPFWLLAAIALALHDRESREWWRRAAMLAAAPTAAGIIGELLKIVVRRQRPPDVGSAYAFRAIADHPFSSRGLGFPSSHAVVAFGAAAILSRMFPRARVVWYAAAASCAFSRLLAHAHYLSDVVAGAAIGVGAGWAVSAWLASSEGETG